MQNDLLKRAFLVDGIGSMASVVLLVGGAQALSGPLGLSAGFLLAVGWLLLPIAIMFLWIARTGSRPLAVLGVAGNLGWVVLSAVTIGALQPTLLGAVVIALQAVAVGVVAWFEYQGLRRVNAGA